MNVPLFLPGRRSILFGLALLLVGCSTPSLFSQSTFSWSDLSPLNWFSSSIKVTEKGVGGLGAETILTENAINEGLKGHYRLRSGMATNHGQLISFYQALKGDQIKLVISGQSQQRIEQIEVVDKNIPSQWGIKIGTPFSRLYKKAFGSCKKGSGDDINSVECLAPDSQHVSYLFSGKWYGPEELMPSDEVLKNWVVSKIIWRN